MKIGKIWRHWQSLIYLETKWKIFEESRSRQLFNTFYKTYLAFFIVEILKSLYYSVFMKFSTSVFRFEHFHLMLINWLWSGKPETRSILWVLIVCLVQKETCYICRCCRSTMFCGFCSQRQVLFMSRKSLFTKVVSVMNSLFFFLLQLSLFR